MLKTVEVHAKEFVADLVKRGVLAEHKAISTACHLETKLEEVIAEQGKKMLTPVGVLVVLGLGFALGLVVGFMLF